MKVSIIGPSASGKSTLANLIANKYEMRHIDLDHIIFQNTGKKRRKERKAGDYLKKIESESLKDNWVIEGINPFEFVFDEADLIVWLKPHFLTALYRQWKRYFTSKRQRHEYGLISNLGLSIYILRQCLGVSTDEADPKRTWVKSVERILKNYSSKVLVISNSKDINVVYSKINELAQLGRVNR